MINELGPNERSLLFAQLAAVAYQDRITKKDLKTLGFSVMEFYNHQGAQAWRFEDRNNVVIACRGTQPTEFNDIKADLRALPVKAETVSRVHKGFKVEVDDIWPRVLEDIQGTEKTIWF